MHLATPLASLAPGYSSFAWKGLGFDEAGENESNLERWVLRQFGALPCVQVRTIVGLLQWICITWLEASRSSNVITRAGVGGATCAWTLVLTWERGAQIDQPYVAGWAATTAASRLKVAANPVYHCCPGHRTAKLHLCQGTEPLQGEDGSTQMLLTSYGFSEIYK